MIIDLRHDLAAFRSALRDWLTQTISPDWSDMLARDSEADYVALQKWWMTERHKGGFAVPHWPAEMLDHELWAPELKERSEARKAPRPGGEGPP